MMIWTPSLGFSMIKTKLNQQMMEVICSKDLVFLHLYNEGNQLKKEFKQTSQMEKCRQKQILKQ
jgi:hypothetical protein